MLIDLEFVIILGNQSLLNVLKSSLCDRNALSRIYSESTVFHIIIMPKRLDKDLVSTRLPILIKETVVFIF